MTTKRTLSSYRFQSHQRQIKMVFHHLVSSDSGEVCAHECLAVYNHILRKGYAAILNLSRMTTFEDNKSKNTGDEHGRESLACLFPPSNLQRRKGACLQVWTCATKRAQPRSPPAAEDLSGGTGLSQAAPRFLDKLFEKRWADPKPALEHSQASQLTPPPFTGGCVTMQGRTSHTAPKNATDPIPLLLPMLAGACCTGTPATQCMNHTWATDADTWRFTPKYWGLKGHHVDVSIH